MLHVAVLKGKCVSISLQLDLQPTTGNRLIQSTLYEAKTILSEAFVDSFITQEIHQYRVSPRVHNKERKSVLNGVYILCMLKVLL